MGAVGGGGVSGDNTETEWSPDRRHIQVTCVSAHV